MLKRTVILPIVTFLTYFLGSLLLCELQKQMKWGMNYGTDKNCTVRRESEESEAVREGSYASCKW